MLSSLVKEHHAKQAVKKEELGKKNDFVFRMHKQFGNDFHGIFMRFSEQNRKEALAASGELTQALVDHLNVG